MQMRFRDSMNRAALKRFSTDGLIAVVRVQAETIAQLRRPTRNAQFQYHLVRPRS